jgi:hypothetical protein
VTILKLQEEKMGSKRKTRAAEGIKRDKEKYRKERRKIKGTGIINR